MAGVSTSWMKKWQQIREDAPRAASTMKQTSSETNPQQNVVITAPNNKLANVIPLSMPKYLPWIYSSWFFLHRAFMQAPQQTHNSAAPYPPMIDPRIEQPIPKFPSNCGISEIQLMVQQAAPIFICVVRLILIEGAKELVIMNAKKLTINRTGPMYLNPFSLCSYMQVTIKLNEPQVVKRMRKNMLKAIVYLRAFITYTTISLSIYFLTTLYRFHQIITNVNFTGLKPINPQNLNYYQQQQNITLKFLIMRKIKQDDPTKTHTGGFIVKNEGYRDKQAEKTIQQLKQSIGSIEKMIEKSQKILRDTRPLKIRETRSDSLELKLNFNSSKSRDKDPIKHNYKERLNELSTTIGTRNTTKASTPLANQFNSFRQRTPKQSNLPYFPHKPKPQKPYLYIDTENLDDPQGDKPSGRDNIFIHDSKSPVSTVHYQRELLEDSFADSLQNAFNFGRRIRTEALNDSDERSFLEQSIQRNSIERLEDGRKQRQTNVRKVILKKKPKNNNLNLNHMKTYSELEQSLLKKPKRQFIFQVEKSPQKIKQGKYSYTTKPKPNLNENPSKPQTKKNEKAEPMVYKYASYPAADHCLKFNKENSNLELDEFYKKVKKFGFVERYLNYSQIGCIYEYLRKSQIPQHKWPLYVVDKVYEKMQGLSRLKI